MLNKILISIIFALSILGGTLGYISYNLIEENAIIKERYEQVAEKNEKLSNELKLSRESCKIDDKFILESIKTNKSLLDIQRDGLEKIDVIEQNRSVREGVKNEENKIHTIRNDTKLPDDLSILLHNTYDNLRRENDSNNSTR